MDHESVLVGPETADDAGVYLVDGIAMVATADFITPVCDDARRYGRIAAANSISDVYAMGGTPLFALNLCCFPDGEVPEGTLADILLGAADAVKEADAVILGGHSVADDELKFGLAVVGRADPDRLLTNAAAVEGDALVLTKPLGTGVLINAYKVDKLDDEGLEPALVEMERLNSTACRLGLEHGAHAATDVTGFALAGHSLEVAKASGVGIEIDFERLPVLPGFYDLVKRGVSTGSTKNNERNTAGHFEDRAGLDSRQKEVLFDPQTSGGLLLSVPAERAEALVEALLASGHTAAPVGRVTAGPARVTVL